MPAIVLTRVDLPAPLSPTRPTTSWEWTSKSTPSSACTAPNLLVTPLRASSVAFDSIGAFLRSIVPPGRAAAPGDDSASPGAARGVTLDGLRNARGLARGCERLGADLGRLPEAVLDHSVLDVVLGDGDRRARTRLGLLPGGGPRGRGEAGCLPRRDRPARRAVVGRVDPREPVVAQ